MTSSFRLEKFCRSMFKDQPQSNLVLISGSGRSGSSLLSLALEQLGFVIPGRQIAPNSTNPSGFGEPEWLINIHKGFLRSGGIRVADANPAAFSLIDQASYKRKILEAFNLISLRLAAQNVVLKDPRLIFFLSSWPQICADQGFSLHLLVPYRDPLEVVASKLRRFKGKKSASYLLAAWVLGVLRVEVITRGWSRAFVAHDKLILDPLEATRGAIGKLSAALHLHDDPPQDSKLLLSPGLRHSRVTDLSESQQYEIVNSPFYALAVECFQILRNGDEKMINLDADSVNDLFNRYRELYATDFV